MRRQEIDQDVRDKGEYSGRRAASLAPVLPEYADLMSRAERLLLAQLKAGRTWTGDLKVSFYQPLGISAVHLDMAYRQLMAKLASVSELAKEHAKDLAHKAASKKVDIKRKTLALARAKKARVKLAEELATLSVKLHERGASMMVATEMHRADELFALKQLLIKYHARNRSIVLRKTQDVPGENRFSHDARGGQRAGK